jgi:hypothetical protein
MKKIVFALVISLFTFSKINAQEVEVKRSFGENTFYQNDKKLNIDQLKELMKNNSEAFDLVKSAKSNQIWGMILSGTGGLLIGLPIGTAIGGGDPEWALAGAGAILVLATIPILKGFNRKTKKAVELYNTGLPIVGSNFQPEFNLNIKGLGLGLSMNF